MPETPDATDIIPADADGLFSEESAIPAATLDPTEVFDESAEDTPGTRVGAGDHEPRFDGDTSELPPEVCWTLQELVAAPHISGSGRHWAVMLQHEKKLRSRLSELGLLLEINHEHRYAFTRQADDPSPHSRTILRAKTLSLAASTLALYLYQQYLASPDNPVVETADMIDHMMAYKRADDTDEAAFQKKVVAAIKSLDDAAIIKPVKGTDRYLVYGVITSLLTAERVEALTRRYQAIARGEAPADDDAPISDVPFGDVAPDDEPGSATNGDDGFADADGLTTADGFADDDETGDDEGGDGR
ncbi:DUF4194 domain-containing protein [Phytoactinopolyspora halotolerans]|uniref:DUF4194 domain-containing protein n=1 Tax=Phytoactinopolyspora halotolerans TaxID=1981512 RepID=A0A6L9S1R9_9ACTN|nr:DUF4194 domain-containing protein [Phytoactinopolyspora halotolerans]NED98593.1 DUF4194 domain-containing protein [Phytoactinopolyspora halotolerans]